ncbi:hypothetical protein [Rhizobium sp. YTU87027]|uniref:hypothetical protein n=1 Tax=Rhizobium sp. YTU87027 TaxID=3417741 RepID=UPI003D697A75
MAAAWAKGKRPGRQPLDITKMEAAIKLVETNVLPGEAARQLKARRPFFDSGSRIDRFVIPS